MVGSRRWRNSGRKKKKKEKKKVMRRYARGRNTFLLYPAGHLSGSHSAHSFLFFQYLSLSFSYTLAIPLPQVRGQWAEICVPLAFHFCVSVCAFVSGRDTNDFLPRITNRRLMEEGTVLLPLDFHSRRSFLFLSRRLKVKAFDFEMRQT